MKKMPLEKVSIGSKGVALHFNDGSAQLTYASKDEPKKNLKTVFDGFFQHFKDMTGLGVSEEDSEVNFVKRIINKQGDAKYMIGIVRDCQVGVHSINSPLVHEDDCKKGMNEHWDLLQEEVYQYMAGNRKQADLFAGDPSEYASQGNPAPKDVDF